MNRHHPRDATLADFAAGTLDKGRSLVVAAHLAMCAECREFVSSLEEVGGQLLNQIEPVVMTEGAAARALSLLPQQPGAGRQPRVSPALRPVWQPEQQTLLGHELGAWRWVSPGLHYRVVKMPAGSDTRVFILKAKPGLKIPAHTHRGTELTTVLAGAFIHEGGRYAAGDCDDADESDGHSPVIDEGEECVCLVAVQGQIRLNGMFGRLIQPFIRI